MIHIKPDCTSDTHANHLLQLAAPKIRHYNFEALPRMITHSHLPSMCCSMQSCPASLVVYVHINAIVEGGSNKGFVSSIRMVPYVSSGHIVLISLGCHVLLLMWHNGRKSLLSSDLLSAVCHKKYDFRHKISITLHEHSCLQRRRPALKLMHRQRWAG